MGTSAPAETFDMVFHVQLAHGSPTKQVRDFTNVKQLYESIAKVFGIATESILYCTLNTHKIDMTRLLGGQIGLDDFMFAHIASPDGAKEVKVNKNGPALGLTISDNGAGFAFIKKIRDDSIMSAATGISVGDHIAKINGTDLKGCRHFEVARTLKEIPIGSEFSIAVVSPQAAFDTALKPREAMGGTGNVGAGSGKKTLRMKKDGTAVVEEIDDAVVKIVGEIDDISTLSLASVTLSFPRPSTTKPRQPVKPTYLQKNSTKPSPTSNSQMTLSSTSSTRSTRNFFWKG